MNCDALIVGINRYDRLRPLRLPAADAEAIARLLGEQGDFRITRLPERIAPDRTGVAIDPDARVCEAALERAIVQLFRPAGDQYPDTALLFVAGHGLQYNPGLPVSSLAASDTDPEARRLGLSLKWLGELLQASPVRNQIVWLDTCHSGGLLDFRQADPGRGTRCLIAASRNFEAAFEAIDGRHGVLTGALLQGLDPARQPDGRVTNLTLAADINRLLAGETQHPLCANSGEAILLTRRAVELAISASPTGRCPYKGLRFFDRDGEDPADFFGRRALTDQLIDRLRQASFLAVLGVSGSGKSSVVRAGLLHALKRGERIGGSQDWRQVIMVPGSHPLASLHAALIRQQTDVDEGHAADLLATGSAQTLADIARTLTQKPLPLVGGGVGERGSHQASESSQAPAPPAPGNRLILLIDQFEEVFTNAGDAARQSFLACLLGALDLAADRLSLIITLRADFYAKCAEQDYSGLARRIQDHQVIVQPMSPAELREAIVAPARRVGLTVDEDLVVQLVEEVHDAPGNLPLLQDTLTELWQQAQARGGAAGRLTLADYRIQEGLAGTLRRRADLFYDQSLAAEEQAAAQWVLIQLTRLGEGTEDTRRRLPQSDLVNARFGARLIARTVAKLASKEARLLVTSSLLPRGGAQADAQAQVATCEVAHEALIRHWPRLRKWLDDNRAFQTWLRRLQSEAVDWVAHGRDPDRLPRGAKLAEAEERRNQAPDLLDANTADYVWAGLAQRDKARQAEERRQAELRMLQQERTESLFDAQITHAALLARLENYAEAREVLRQTIALDASIPEGRRHIRNLLAAYIDTLGGRPEQVYRGAGAALSGGLAVSPDGRWIAAAGERGTLLLFDAQSGELVRRFTGDDPASRPTGEVCSVVFDPAGRWLFSGDDQGRISRWSVPEGDKLGEWVVPVKIRALAISPNGQLLASGGNVRGIALWSTETGDRRVLRGHTGNLAPRNSLVFSADGMRLASVSFDKTARIWDLESDSILNVLRGDNDELEAVAFSPDGKVIAIAGDDKRIALWDTDTGERLRILTGHTNTVVAVAFDADCRQLLSAGCDKTLRLWDIASGVNLRIYQGHSTGLWDLTCHANSLYTAADDQMVCRWSLDTPGQWVWGLPDEPKSVAVAPDGGVVVVGFRDGAVRAYAIPGSGGDAPCQSGETIAEARGVHGSGGVKRIAFNADGTLFATAGMEGTAKLWRIDRGASGLALVLIHSLDGHMAAVHAVAFSTDGRRLATAGYDGRVGLFDVETGVGALFVAHEGPIANVEFHPDGERLLSVGINDFKLRLWDLTKQAPTVQEVGRAQDEVLWAALRPDGCQLAAVGRGSRVTLHDLGREAAEPRRLIGHEQAVLRAIYGPGSCQLATVSTDMTVRLWNLETAKEVFALRLPTRREAGSPLWDFDFRCTPAGDCWIAVPLTMGRLALYRLPYAHPPASIAGSLASTAGAAN